jgi:hypothetical protein
MIPVACHPGSHRHAHTITSPEREPLVTPDMSFMTPTRTTPCAIAEPAASAHKAATATPKARMETSRSRAVF